MTSTRNTTTTITVVSVSCSLHTTSLVVGYLDNQLKVRSPAKLGPRSVLLMGSSPPDPVLSGAPACGPPAPRA
jgi:hypothetical protein